MRQEVAHVAGHLWPLWFIWLPLGLTRLTQVALFDRILDAPRKTILRRVNPNDYPPGDDRLNLIAYVMMCVFCMSLELAIVLGVLLCLPWTSDYTVVGLTVVGASYLVPLLDHLQDHYLPGAGPTAEQVAAWSHGGVAPQISLADEVAGLENDTEEA